MPSELLIEKSHVINDFILYAICIQILLDAVSIW